MFLTERLEIATASNVGRVRRNNEDFHRAAVYPVPNGNLLMAAVADGMGGAEAGEVASKIAIESLSEAVRSYAEHLSSQRPSVPIDRLVHKAFSLAQRRILKHVALHPELKGMGTTMTALVALEPSWKGFIGHIGDSRAYRYRRGNLQMLTQDHSWVAQQVRLGRMTHYEAEEHPWRNLLTQALGVENAEFEIIPTKMEKGDVYIFTTDGLYNLVSPEEWIADLDQKDLQTAVDYWTAQAVQRGGTDNITVVAVRVK
ncbi:PP2C family protein-serine/threonine phosphatase [Oceanithermus sp.]